jgi:hypothetical protein
VQQTTATAAAAATLETVNEKFSAGSDRNHLTHNVETILYKRWKQANYLYRLLTTHSQDPYSTYHTTTSFAHLNFFKNRKMLTEFTVDDKVLILLHCLYIKAIEFHVKQIP